MIPPRPRLKKPLPNKLQPDIDKLLVLLEQWTRADVMSRVGSLKSDVDYARTKVEKADEIKVLLYGTCSLVELADKFGIK